MALTSKDREEIETAPFKEPAFTGVVLHVLRFLGHIPWLKAKLNDTVGGLNSQIFRCWEAARYEEAVNIALYALDKYRDNNNGSLGFMNHHHWWSFMRYAVKSIEKSGDLGNMKQTLERAREGIEPFEGYDVAFSFVAFSLWKFKEERIEEAVDLAKTASEADPTWGYPEFLLGWYCLVAGGGDASRHLANAVQRDPRIIFRVASDPICHARPDISSKLKALAVSEGIVSSSNKPFQADAAKPRG